MMGLEQNKTVLEQNKNNRNILNKVLHRELKKKSEHKFLMINMKPLEKLTLISSKSEIKSHFGIMPL